MSLSDIKYDWVTSAFYKKDMHKWAVEYLKNNEVDFDSIKLELVKLIMEDNAIRLNSFNRYGAFEMLWSSVPNALVGALIKASSDNYTVPNSTTKITWRCPDCNGSHTTTADRKYYCTLLVRS